MSQTQPTFDPTNPAHVNQMMESLQARISFLETNQTPPQTASLNSRQPKIANPEKYGGDKESLRDFLATCRSVFIIRSADYDTDTKKILFIGNLLTGPARTWFRVQEENATSLMVNYEEFVTGLKDLFGDPNAQTTAQNKLRVLTQGRGSVANYTSHFMNLIFDSGYDIEARKACFYNGLSDEVKDGLALTELPNDLTALIKMATKLDNRLFDRRRSAIRNRIPTSPPMTPPQRTVTWKPALTTNSWKPKTIFPRPNGSSGPTPMDLDKTTHVRAITPEERTRRMDNKLCLYCGKPNHIAVDCPNKNAKVRAATRSTHSKNSEEL